jgi:hypothetical protein
LGLITVNNLLHEYLPVFFTRLKTVKNNNLSGDIIIKQIKNKNI